MKNQGYITYGIDYFENLVRTEGVDGDAVNALGVYDGVLLEEAARIISRKSSKAFTAHIVTATTHSPWTYPKQFSPVFANNRMNVFHYVDRSLEAFVKKLRDELPDFDQTLFAITGDHTSAAVEDDDAERIRVPLILVNAQLTGLRGQFEGQSKTFGSHMDIVPTILGLLGRPYCYSGMGMDLLNSKSANKGAITSNRRESYYLQGSFILTYAPNRNTSELRAFDQKRIIHGDISQKYPEVFDRMKHEYLAFYETSKRLTRGKATFPRAIPRPACQ
jgi:phosphoglycerol transferase MdoB-like AlkP superfamily enzyme